MAKTDPEAARLLANMEMVLPAHPWTATTDEEDSRDLTLSEEEISQRRRARALHRVTDVGSPNVIVHDPMFLRIDKAPLPLSLFDSEEMFERHTPKQWLRLSRGQVRTLLSYMLFTTFLSAIGDGHDSVCSARVFPHSRRVDRQPPSGWHAA